MKVKERSAWDEAADDAVEIPAFALVDAPLHAHLLAEQLIEVDGVLLGDQIELEVEQFGDSLVAGQADQQQLVLPQGGGQLHRALAVDEHG